MGILSGSDNSGQKNQRKENRRAQSYIEDQLGLSVGDVNQYYPVADQYRTDAYNQAMNLIGDGGYQQMDYLRRGNVGAQDMLINSMPQYQNALFGMPVDYSQFQSVDLGMPDRSAFNAQLAQPNTYPGYASQGAPPDMSVEGRGPWASMAYGLVSTPPYVEEGRGFGQKMQDFGNALAGNGRAGGEGMGGKLQAFGNALGGERQGRMAAIMQLLGG